MKITRNTILKGEFLLALFTWAITICCEDSNIALAINALCIAYIGLYAYANDGRVL